MGLKKNFFEGRRQKSQLKKVLSGICRHTGQFQQTD